MPDVDYPPVLHVSQRRLFALAWAVLFFVVINVAIFLFFRSSPADFQRFSQHTSAEEIDEMVAFIRSDRHRKIVFIGGSVLWGASSRSAKDTVPLAFASMLPANVHVYNLGLIGARPLDEFLLAQQLQGSADLLVLDYNYAFGFPVSRARLLTEPETYVRMQQLYHEHASSLYANMPGIPACLQAFGLETVRPSQPVELFLRSTEQKVIPLMRYKNRVNDLLFGQHPLLFIQRGLLLASGLLSGTKHFSIAALLALHQIPEERIDPASWKGSRADVPQGFFTDRFDQDSVIACMEHAFDDYVQRAHLPVVLYLTPNNPAMFKPLLQSDLYRSNISLLHAGTPHIPFYTFDDAPLSADAFTSSTHFTPAGAHLFAAQLFKSLRPVLVQHGLLAP